MSVLDQSSSIPIADVSHKYILNADTAVNKVVFSSLLNKTINIITVFCFDIIILVAILINISAIIFI